MRGRRLVKHSQLTSLVDVLFILLFASLVQQRRAAEAADANAEPEEAPTPIEEPIDAGVPDAAPEPAADPHQSARAVAEQLETDTVILVAVDGAGTVSSIEWRGERTETDLPLLRATVDERVVAYAATDRPDLRLCKLVRSTLATDIAGALVLVSTADELRALPYALVRGLRADTSRCLDDAGAYALMVRAADLPPQSPSAP